MPEKSPVQKLAASCQGLKTIYPRRLSCRQGYMVCALARSQPGIGLANELHGHLRHAVGLRKHGHRGLGENLVADKLGHFRGHVHIGNAGFRSLQVFGLGCKVCNCVFKTILQGAKMSADLVLGHDGVVDADQSLWAAACVETVRASDSAVNDVAWLPTPSADAVAVPIWM